MSSPKADKIYVGHALTFVLTFWDNNEVVDDLDQATTLSVRFRQPDGTLVTRTASLFTNGKDGKIKYDTDIAIDLQQPGLHVIYGVADYGGRPVPSDSERFLVHPLP